MKNKSFWITLCLINLSIVALLGLGLRSKMLFYMPAINFQFLESAHSHFAFAGWAALSLLTYLIYNVLPAPLGQKIFYQWILVGIQLSSMGMVIIFPFYGYNAASIFFSTLYIAVSLVFFPTFLRDLVKAKLNRTITLLCAGSLTSLILSFLGTLGLVYILLSKSGNSILYRDSIYTFLHFQYNGFFTLAIFAIFFNELVKKNVVLTRNVWMFSVFLCASIVPALFLSLLWHNNTLYYVLASAGSLFIIISLFYFVRIFSLERRTNYSSSLVRAFLIFAAISFALKMLLNVGTIIPQLGDAIYGNRPVIIGFLHLVFLGFLSFFLLYLFIEEKYFTRRGKLIRFPFFVFASGIFANELLLMVQGLGILFSTNSEMFKWFLWVAAILLFLGAVMIFIARLLVIMHKKKDIA